MSTPESITVDGHMYVHVAACPCPEMRAEMRRLGLDDAQLGEPPHRRGPEQDYDPTPSCQYCFKAWDPGGNIKDEYACLASRALPKETT
jgi:hypothetical protein